MDLERLYEILDIEDPSEFMYFENLAELLEYEDPFDPDVVYQLMGQVDLETFCQLIESYFDDIIGSIPGEESEMIQLLESEKDNLMTLCKPEEGDDHGILRLSDRLMLFKEWYSEIASCSVEKDDEVTMMPPRDAFAEARLARLGEEIVLDFSSALNYGDE